MFRTHKYVFPRVSVGDRNITYILEMLLEYRIPRACNMRTYVIIHYPVIIYVYPSYSSNELYKRHTA